MNSSVVSFFRFGSTVFAETVLRAGWPPTSCVLAESGLALSVISPTSAEPLSLLASIHG